MAVLPRLREPTVIRVECRACHWARALLVYTKMSTAFFFCPHCQHVWHEPPTVPKIVLNAVAGPDRPSRNSRLTGLVHGKSGRHLEVFCEGAALWTDDDYLGPLFVQTSDGTREVEGQVPEWAGLLANQWLGHSDSLFPSPQP